MTRKQIVWIDAERCTGCGACVDVCPVGAIALTNGTASVADETCTGCGACLEVCPQDAIHPVVEGELVPAVAPAKPAVQRERPLVQTAAPALAVAGASLMAKAAGALARVVGNWLAQPSGRSDVARGDVSSDRGSGGANGGGRRMRRRRRGR